MDEEFRRRVADILGGLSPMFKAECVEELLALIASVRVREQREAFVAGWRAAYDNTNFNVHTEAARRYPDPEVTK